MSIIGKELIDSNIREFPIFRSNNTLNNIVKKILEHPNSLLLSDNDNHYLMIPNQSSENFLSQILLITNDSDKIIERQYCRVSEQFIPLFIKFSKNHSSSILSLSYNKIQELKKNTIYKSLTNNTETFDIDFDICSEEEEKKEENIFYSMCSNFICM